MIIIVDGPEKAGKSTLISLLRKELAKSGLESTVRRWGPVDPDDRVYTPALIDDVRSYNQVIFWDRSWASEHVYANLLGRDRRLRNDSWLGEWLHSRAVTPNGMLIMVTAGVAELKSKRDKTDIDIDPAVELNAFHSYGVDYSWNIIHNKHDGIDNYVKNVVSELADKILSMQRIPEDSTPPTYCGPANAGIIVVGDERKEKIETSQWLPFTSRLTTLFGRKFGADAMNCGWTNAHDCKPSLIRSAQLVISCGETAKLWVDNYVKPVSRINVPHPSYLYRYSNERTMELRQSVERVIEAAVRSIQTKG